MRGYFIESVILIQWDRVDEQEQLIRWTVISVLVVYDQKNSLMTSIIFHISDYFREKKSAPQ